MEVSGHVHAPATLFPGKEPPVSIRLEAGGGGGQSRSVRYGTKNKEHLSTSERNRNIYIS
jgi:hypothetical protein